MSKSVWEVYKNSSDTFRQACVTEWRSWLEEVKPETARRKLEARLQSDKNNDHFSARMELYFHHYFKSRGCEIEIHPDLPDTKEHPEFLILHDCGSLILEARISQQEKQSADQEEFANNLRKALRNIDTPHSIDIELDNSMAIPGLGFFLDEIIRFVADNLKRFDKTTAGKTTKEWNRQIMGKSCRIQFRFKRGEGLGCPSQVDVLHVGSIGTKKLYDNIVEKVGRYGDLRNPYVIAMWDLSDWTKQDQYIERQVLYGQLEAVVERDYKGNPIRDYSRIKPDGVFANARHDKVSACVFYTHRLSDTGSEHFRHVYHNPYATAPLPTAIFEGSPQLIPVKTNTGFDISKWTVQPKY